MKGLKLLKLQEGKHFIFSLGMCSTELVSDFKWNRLDTNEATLSTVCNSLLAEIAMVHLGGSWGELEGVFFRC